MASIMSFNMAFALDKSHFYNLGGDLPPLEYAVLAEVLEDKVDSIKNVKVTNIRRVWFDYGIFPIFLFKSKWRKLKFQANLIELDEAGLQKFECDIKIIKAFEVIFIDKCESSHFILELKTNLTFEKLKLTRPFSWYIN